MIRGIVLAPWVASAVAAMAFAFVPAAHAQNRPRPDRGDWDVVVGTYLWASGLDGQVGIGDNVVDVDIGFSDVIDHLDGALFLPIEMRKGRWGAVIELMALRLSGQRGTPGPLFDAAELDVDQTLIEISPRYWLVRRGPLAVDALAGIRLWHLSSTLTLDPGPAAGLPDVPLGLGEQWVDPILGARAVADLGGRWLVHGRGDLGGFGVGSDFTWQLIGLLGYRLSSSTTLRAGYRQLDVDFEDEDDGFLYDVGTGGWIIGVTIRL
ncbi:MAG TPA: hypothetical protein VF188_09700 [Longimicrobiales bacterium]